MEVTEYCNELGVRVGGLVARLGQIALGKSYVLSSGLILDCEHFRVCSTSSCTFLSMIEK